MEAVTWLEAALVTDGWTVYPARKDRPGKRLAVREPVRFTFWADPERDDTFASAWGRDSRGCWAALRTGTLADVVRVTTWRCAAWGGGENPQLSAWGWLEPFRRVVEVSAYLPRQGRGFWSLADLPPCVQAVAWDWLGGGEAAREVLWDLVLDLPPGRAYPVSNPIPPREATYSCNGPLAGADIPIFPFWQRADSLRMVALHKQQGGAPDA